MTTYHLNQNSLPYPSLHLPPQLFLPRPSFTASGSMSLKATAPTSRLVMFHLFRALRPSVRPTQEREGQRDKATSCISRFAGVEDRGCLNR